MFTEDYLLRIINQAVAALTACARLRKAGKAAESLQLLQQAAADLTGLPPDLAELMDDASLLNALGAHGWLEPARLAVLARLFQEQGQDLTLLGQPAQAGAAFSSALRFTLEAALTDTAGLPAGAYEQVEHLLRRLGSRPLPPENQEPLAGFYQRLLEMDDEHLTAAGASRAQVLQALASLQALSGSTPVITEE